MITFYKYQGAGNDFIMIDNRDKNFKVNKATIEKLCDRRFGIGADGLILIENSMDADFEMLYYNADGGLGSMCGNGGRCAVAFARSLNMINDETVFKAFDGLHQAHVLVYNASNKNAIVRLQMRDVTKAEINDDFIFMNTGSPHYIKFVDDVMHYDVVNKGREIRNNERFKAEGTNVNFVEVTKEGITVRTYERGVEDETLSCGTGVTAAAIAYGIRTHFHINKVAIKTLGGDLNVSFLHRDGIFTDVHLQGPATFVYNGSIENA